MGVSFSSHVITPLQSLPFVSSPYGPNYTLERDSVVLHLHTNREKEMERGSESEGVRERESERKRE